MSVKIILIENMLKKQKKSVLLETAASKGGLEGLEELEDWKGWKGW